MSGAAVSERTRLEMERGARVLSQRERLDLLQRYDRTPGVVRNIFTNMPTPVGTTRRGESWIVGGVEIARVAVDADDYPSDVLMATLGLAVQALSLPVASNSGIGSDERGPKPSHEGREYAKMLREQNKGRW